MVADGPRRGVHDAAAVGLAVQAVKPPDADRPSYARVQRRRQADRVFLAKLPLLTAADLRLLLSVNQPQWTRIAIRRALDRC